MSQYDVEEAVRMTAACELVDCDSTPRAVLRRDGFRYFAEGKTMWEAVRNVHAAADRGDPERRIM